MYAYYLKHTNKTLSSKSQKRDPSKSQKIEQRKAKGQVLRWFSAKNQQIRVTQWSGQPPCPEGDRKWATRRTVKLQLHLIPEGRDLDNGSLRHEWALDSRMFLNEGCHGHAPCTRQFLWNRQDQPIVGMSKVLYSSTGGQTYRAKGYPSVGKQQKMQNTEQTY